MIITSLVILLVLSALLKPLRNTFYVLHIILVVVSSWLVEKYLGQIDLFSPRAVYTFLILHLIFINFITFTAYFYDKRAANKQKWRIPEKVLLAFALIGGTPAASIASKVLRHKTIKKAFKIRFWLVILIQIIAIALLLLQ